MSVKVFKLRDLYIGTTSAQALGNRVARIQRAKNDVTIDCEGVTEYTSEWWEAFARALERHAYARPLDVRFVNDKGMRRTKKK